MFSPEGQCCGVQEAWLIGEFNNWEGTPLEKDEFGVWATELRDNADGSPAIPHNSKVKLRLKHWDGWTIDLVPAWIKYAVMPEGMDSTFDGVHWDPPAHEKHKWYAPVCYHTQHPMAGCTVLSRISKRSKYKQWRARVD